MKFAAEEITSGGEWRVRDIETNEVVATGMTQGCARLVLDVLDLGPCRHGWRGERAERISTPCPACGSGSLFVGSGGHLTCAVLQCPEPSPQSEINNLRAAIEDGLLTLVAIASQPATAGRLWADNPTLGATLARMRKALRQLEPADPLARRS